MGPLVLVMLTGLVISLGAGAEFNLTILHTNDVHCRFEEANEFGGACTEQESEDGKCYGGYARIAHMTREIRQKQPNTIYLHGGDFFQGTIWYTVHKWEVVSHFGNMLNLTAMSLGNHEFDDGVDGLKPFIERANHPVVAANIDTSGEPRLDGLIPRSTIVEVGGRRIGIIGYLTTETSYVSSPEGVKILDEVKGVRLEAKRLKRQGVDILIAVGHAGYLKDMEIAEKVPDIDVVVGGHTNTFLYNGSPPSIEEPLGSYPTIVEQPSGKKVPVVQAYAFGKYLGNLTVTFNDKGEITNWSGLPILLDKSVPQDPQVLAELVPYRSKIDDVANKEVGKTLVFLDGNRLSCRMAECNLGNLIADSYVNLFTKNAGEGQWSRVAIALLNGGGVRASIDEHSRNGSITYGDLRAVAPFPNTVDVVKITGQTLRDMFEFSVHEYDPSAIEPFGGFLQVSGIRVLYDLTRRPGDRVVDLEVRCNQCRMPDYSPVIPNESYDVAMTNFLAGGGDGYALLKGNIIEHRSTDILDADAIMQYMEKVSPITAGIERRIRFMNETFRSPCSRVIGDRPPQAIKTQETSSAGLTSSVSAAAVTVFAFALMLVSAAI